MAEILPSVFAADLMKLGEEIRFLEQQGFKTLHLDMMDGNLVQNIAFGPDHVNAIKQATTMAVDVHMMVNQPEKLIDKVIATGVEMISIHYEATIHHLNILQRIRAAGIKAGIVYNPSTPLESLKYLRDYVDYVLLMSINPGHWGQSFHPVTIERIRDARKIIGDYPIQIQIDGGVNADIAAQLKQEGVSLIVIGGYLFGKDQTAHIASALQAVR
ncbi:ribulose-phosphate 3-epimerase [Glaesserella sp.]|uniref:ribulose-phosphate 3-epimerase n=1 Tax=Glaesserella sp. TaxID=2094731 RepID=UPI0035A10E23